jgi:tripartite-type tricarboxylate transporter receptor subunit TctC
MAMLVTALDATALPFPNRLVRIVSPYPAGIAPDLAVRLVADKLSRYWNQQVIIEPRPGGNGFIAIGALKKAKTDGHQLLLLGSAHLALNPQFLKNVPYDPENDFVPVAMIYRTPFFIVVANEGPYKTLQDLITAARANPNAITYSTPYVGSPPHIGGALLASMTGTRMLAVQYRDGAALSTSVANGDISFHVSSSGTVAPLVSAGKLRFLAIASAKRSPSEPDVPTVREVGGPDGYEIDTWAGLVAARGTPPAVVKRINTDVLRALAEPDVRDRFRSRGIEVKPGTPEEMGELIRSDAKHYGELIRRAGIAPE